MVAAAARAKRKPWYTSKTARRVAALLAGGVLAAGCSLLAHSWAQPICAAVAKALALVGG